MKLWLLRRRDDTHYGMELLAIVVRAPDEKSARELALQNHGDERTFVWLSAEHSTCEELLSEGKPGLILADYWNTTKNPSGW